MSFPLSPANNQVTLENGIAYTYNASRGAWYRTPVTALTSVTSNNFTVLNSIIFSDGTSQTSAASPNDAYARTTANTNATNITIIQGVDVTQNSRITVSEGVDLTQNTNITIATNAAAAAFAQANATAGGLITANARITVAEGIDVTQNTNITAADTKAQAAFDQANAALTLANTANTTASSGGGGGSTSFTSVVDTFTGNGSQTQFTLSVVPDTETSTFVYLNGVYQNKSTYSLSGANIIFTDTATANDTIEVTTVAGSVMNVSPSGYSTRVYQGNGSANTFTVTAGQTANTVMVFNNGICQFPGEDYTISGTTLTYVLAPEVDEVVQIREMPINKLVALTQPSMRRYTANGVQTNFTVTSGQSANSMFVFENGVCQVPVNDYTVSGTTLTFTTAPTVDKVIQIREMPV